MFTRKVCSPIDRPVAPFTLALTQVVQPPRVNIGGEKLICVGAAEGRKNSESFDVSSILTSGAGSAVGGFGAGWLSMNVDQ
jgi:hypothetical protein